MVEAATPDMLAGLNPAQRAAAETVQGPLCILAGAGTGKTRTVAHRIAHQVACGAARAEEILAVTFTDKAAAELRSRVAGLGLHRPVRAATFHAAALAQLRYFWPRVHGRALPEVLASKIRLLVPAARRYGVEAADLASEVEWAKSRGLDPDGYAAGCAHAGRDGALPAEDMAAIYAAYEREKAERGLIDYEDMLLLATRLLRERPEVAEQVRRRYRSFTVDEFQDVNPAQWELLRAWLGTSHELCVVGDDDQMIYSFTGASSSYLTGFRRRFPAAPVITLTQSYRSTPQVLGLANRVLWTKPEATRKRLVAQRGAGPAPVFREFDDAEGEAAGVVEHLGGLLASGVLPAQAAICYRANSQSEGYEEALRQAGIPYLVRGDGGFFRRREIRQALTALQAAARSGTEPAPADEADRLPGTSSAGPPAAERAVEAVLRQALSWHPRREPAGEAARERWRNLGALLEIVAGLVADQHGLAFAEVVAQLVARASGDPADGPGAVTLSTLHGVKGLEFDAVLLVGLEEGSLPISHAKSEQEIEEERRLLYVGVTRARRHLWLSWARLRPSLRGRPMPRRPSRFLYGLDPTAPRQTGGGGRRRAPGTAGTATAQSPGSPRGNGTAATPATAATVDPAAVAALRAWRRERARRDGVPAYVIFSDRTLAELVARQPSGSRDLLGVYGLGPAKVQRYGAELLAVLGEAAAGR